MPTESGLCTRCNVSRIRVRRAREYLIRGGLVVRSQGKGTFRLKSSSSSREVINGHIEGFWRQQRDLGRTVKTRVLGNRIVENAGSRSPDTFIWIWAGSCWAGIPLSSTALVRWWQSAWLFNRLRIPKSSSSSTASGLRVTPPVQRGCQRSVAMTLKVRFRAASGMASFACAVRLVMLEWFVLQWIVLRIYA